MTRSPYAGPGPYGPYAPGSHHSFPPEPIPQNPPLPAGVEVIRIPGFGTSWWEHHGAGYTARRTLQIAAHLVALSVAIGVTAAIAVGAGFPVGWIILGLEAVIAVCLGVLTYRRARYPSKKRVAKIRARLGNPKALRRYQWVSGACAAGLYILFQADGHIGGLVLGALCFFLPGPVIALVIMCFSRKDLPVEAVARAMMGERIRDAMRRPLGPVAGAYSPGAYPPPASGYYPPPEPVVR